MPTVQLFILLQLFDFLTTIVGFRFGAGEASPFIRLLMQAGPAAGVALSKAVALLIAGVCIYLKRHRLLQFANYWYSGLVIWNLSIIWVAAGQC